MELPPTHPHACARRRHAYHTKSNRTRIVKTPGACSAAAVAAQQDLGCLEQHMDTAAWTRSMDTQMLADLTAHSPAECMVERCPALGGEHERPPEHIHAEDRHAPLRGVQLASLQA